MPEVPKSPTSLSVFEHRVVGWTEQHADQTPSLSTEAICRFADEWCSWVCENPNDAERLSQKAKPILAMDDAPIVRSRLIGSLDVPEIPNVPAVIDSDLRQTKLRSSPKAASTRLRQAGGERPGVCRPSPVLSVQSRHLGRY